ncbi:MAG: triose-phosphate isomerase [Candidatus Sungbacteria bacterium]|uniref:Triosephosphate isomerase n=1 Tax=Candidatus Sungiibacteriota bacterium TaxID=2750080 RepID=A0A9D6HQW7_9BACT|nr:triose-phosphate isomerase [Candidatus Sungbacteria bacterium]
MKLIVGNWKLNPSTLNEAVALASGVNYALKVEDFERMVLLPPFIFLEELAKKFKQIVWGAQDVFWEARGAYTGEVSLAMLKDAGVTWVLIGHSERRRIFGESDEDVNKKIKAALAQDFNVIAAVGELQRGDGADEVVDSFKKSAAGLDPADLARLTVAYEPVWAISTTPGAQADSPARSNQIIGELKHTAFKMFGEPSKKIRFLYGGSVTSENALKFLSQPYIDGALVGGASLLVEEFTTIISSAN